jgi:tetratricopeptide (TPR) repeat protein
MALGGAARGPSIRVDDDGHCRPFGRDTDALPQVVCGFCGAVLPCPRRQSSVRFRYRPATEDLGIQTMKMRFNPPPNWPVPRDWAPGPDRHPDPSWPPPPPGWACWVPDTAPDLAVAASTPPDASTGAPPTPPSPTPPPPSPPLATSTAAPVPSAAPDGLMDRIATLLEAASNADRSGDATRARQAVGEAEQVLRQRVAADPATAEYRVALARVLEVTSEIEVDKDLRRAAGTVEEAVRIRLALVNAESDNVDYLVALGVSYNNLGTVALGHCDAKEAVRWMQASCQVFQDALSSRPNMLEAQHHLAVGAYRLGQIAAADDQNALARAAYEQSVAARRHLAMSPQDHKAWHELGESLIGLGGVQSSLLEDAAALQTSHEAVSAFRSAIAGQDDEQGYRDLTLALVKCAACAANVNDAQTTARQALEAATLWQRYGTPATGRRWPLIAELLNRAAPALQRQDAHLADACQRAAAAMS